jgi:mRNA-degrading endonuclease RelE of RelBE toxin-antitoxin system
MATVVLSSDASASHDALPLRVRVRVTKLLERLLNWPDVSGAKPLTGDLAGKYRLRTGDYRIRFHVETTNTTVTTPATGKGSKKARAKEHVIRHYKVVVEKIGHRDDFYED